MSDADIAEHLEPAPIARANPLFVERVNMPRIAEHATDIAEALVDAALAVLLIRRLTAGEMVTTADDVAVRQLALSKVATALAIEPAHERDHTAEGYLRRYVQSDDDAQGMQMRAVARLLLEGILTGEAFRLAMDPATVGQAIQPARTRMVA
jgi:hypothetical protein